MITITVQNTLAQLSNINDLKLIDAISKQLSYQKKSFEFQKFLHMRTGWDGIYRLLNRKLQFPSGLVDKVCSFLGDHGIPYQVEDQRIWNHNKPLKWKGHNLYPYQEKLVDVCLDKKFGIVKACTGSGKTTAISKIVSELNVQTVIYVVSIDLLEQMRETLTRSLSVPIGMVGGGECDIQKITVCSAWTPGKLFSKTKVVSDEEMKQDKWKPSDEQKKQIIEMVRSAKLVILDETQFAAAETIKTILNNSLSASYRFGLSGTPWRSDGDDLLLEASFGPTIYDLPSSTLIEQGYLVPPMILFRDIPPMDLDYRLSYPEVKSEYIIENKRRNEILIKSLVGLLDIGRKPLVLFKEHKHGEILANMIPSNVKFHVVTGKLKKDERTKIRKQFQDGDIELILASTVYDQGVDLPALDALVLAGGGRSTAKALQRVGRVIRGHPGKKNAWVIDCFDDAPYLSKHSSERYNIFKSEKLFKIRTEPAFTRYLEQSIITK